MLMPRFTFAIVVADDSLRYKNSFKRFVGSSGMIHNPSWNQFLAKLSLRNIRFAVIGGYAVNFYGYLRSTEDLDIIFLRDEKAEAGLLEVLQEYDAFWIGDEIDPKTGMECTYPITAEYLKSNSLIMLGVSFGYVDIFDFLPGMPDASIEDCIAAAQFGNGVPFVSLDWLKKLKIASNRPKDQIDLEHLT